MAVFIVSLGIELQSGGVFNYGEVVINCAKNNIHLEAEANSFNVGDNNLLDSKADKPSIEVNGIKADIVDGDAAQCYHDVCPPQGVLRPASSESSS